MVSLKAVQIIVPVKHKLQLQLEQFIEILEADNIRDRNVAIISIAGALRKGKSYLLNFFLKYLYAQYKKHDVTDWIGEGQKGGDVHGFKSRGGRKPETTGIWMWSEIFTHDYENGEKVAIILLDTQGIFDNKSSMKDCTATFAISMMLASVQCFNISQQVQENDLQHLDLFTEYGRFAIEQSNEIPFQKLLFIVRDWQYENEVPYGYSKMLIDDVLELKEEQELEMHQLRNRIKSCFEDIDAFLLPHPGFTVAKATDFCSDLTLIEPEFIENLKVLVPSIFAPEKLIVKKIFGQKVKAHQFKHYLETFVKVFNENQLPPPTTVLTSIAATNNLMLFTSCFKSYTQIMDKYLEERSLNPDKPYFDPNELLEIHDITKEDALSQFSMAPKLGDKEMIEQCQIELRSEIKAKFQRFQKENDKKQRNFHAMAKSELHALFSDCYHSYIESMQKNLINVDECLSDIELKTLHESVWFETMSKFEAARKRGSDEMIEMYTNMLLNQIQMKFYHFEKDNEWKRKWIEDLKNKTDEAATRAKIEARADAAEKAAAEAMADTKNNKLYYECKTQYRNSLQTSMSACNTFYNQHKLMAIHNTAKDNAIALFEKNRIDGGQEIMLDIRLGAEIDKIFIDFEQQNDRKVKEYEKSNELAALKKEAEDRWCSIM